MLLRLGIASLIVVLVAGAFLGFASGDFARHIWNKHPRHTGAPQTADKVTLKTPPGAMATIGAIIVLPLAGLVPLAPALAVAGAPMRPPFVPPRG